MPSLTKSLMTTLAQQKLQSFPTRPTGAFLTECNNYISGVCDAIVFAHNLWRTQAYFSLVKINGAIATGGKLNGPSLESMITMQAPRVGLKNLAGKYSASIAKGIAGVWTDFQGGCRVGGVPWYPSFQAFPGPVAPHTPNVPTPMLTCAPNVSILSTGSLKARMVAAHGGPGPLTGELFESIAAGFSQAATIWLSSQQVVGVIGWGPVPAFQPPQSPVGMVVNGDIVAAPPHLGT